ncbi:MAG: hypothetical protein ACRDND_08645 [Streptosporangiaceae bacterium]
MSDKNCSDSGGFAGNGSCSMGDVAMLPRIFSVAAFPHPFWR